MSRKEKKTISMIEKVKRDSKTYDRYFNSFKNYGEYEDHFDLPRPEPIEKESYVNVIDNRMEATNEPV